MSEFKHLDIKKVSETGLAEWIKIAKLQGMWTSANSLKHQAESFGASDVMMKQFDVHIARIEEQLPQPSEDVSQPVERA